MGIFGSLLFIIFNSYAIEGTFVFSGSLDQPYHTVSLSPIKSLTHLAQNGASLRYQADQVALVDGHEVGPVIYDESPTHVTVSVGEADSANYYEFLVTKEGLRRVNTIVSEKPLKNRLTNVTVSR